MSEQFVNFGVWFLALPCGAGDVTLSLSSIVGLPPSGTFSFGIGPVGGVPTEIVTVNTVTAGAPPTLGVSRGEVGTAIAHATGSQLTPIMTARAMAQIKSDVLKLRDVTLTAGTYPASPNTSYFCDVSTGPIVLNVPALSLDQWISVTHGNGSLTINSITVNATSPQKLSQPPPLGAAQALASYIIGGANSSSGAGAADASTSLIWFNGGVTNVLNVR